MRSLVCFVAAVLSLSQLPASEAPAAGAKIRVIGRTHWRDEMLRRPLPDASAAIDVVVPLAAVPAGASIMDLLATAERIAGGRTARDFISRVRVLRPSQAEGEYDLVEKGRLRDFAAWQTKIRDGDIVVFHGITDVF
jgi:hypothetical protein